MTKEDTDNFKNSTECWICGNGYVDNDIKRSLPNHKKYRGPTHK